MPNFVPLSLKSLPEATGKIVSLPSPAGPNSAPNPSAPHGFQPLAQVLPPVKSSPAPAPSPTPAPAQAAAPAGGSHQPAQIQLQRQDGHITGIRVQCSCGQVIDLECLYEPG